MLIHLQRGSICRRRVQHAPTVAAGTAIRLVRAGGALPVPGPWRGCIGAAALGVRGPVPGWRATADHVEHYLGAIALQAWGPLSSPIVDTPRRVTYGLQMIDVRATEAFSEWLSDLRDARAKAELALGNPGDVKPAGEGVSELRIHYGPGYRAYYVPRGSLLIVLLCGGDKDSQAKDIALALTLAKEV